MKKILSVFLALAVILCSTSVVFASEDTNAVEISSAEQFAGIVGNLSGSYKLTADITLTAGVAGIFTGTFDGNGHTITIGSADAPAASGIFQTLGAGAVVKNLTIDGAVTSSTTVGALASNATSWGAANAPIKIENCINLANVTVNVASNGQYIGGFVGLIGGTGPVEFSNSSNYGAVYTTYTGSYRITAAGGFAGQGNNVKMQYCVNYGSVDGQGNQNKSAGGLLGIAGVALDVDNCANFGTVAARSDGYAGGIIGKLFTTSTSANLLKSATVDNCLNAGVLNSHYSGGMSGGRTSDEQLSYNVFSNCINVGSSSTDANTFDICAYAVNTGCYAVTGSAKKSNTNTTTLSADEIKALNLTNFALTDSYAYPLPIGIEYVSKEEASSIKISTAAGFMNIVNNLSGNYKLTKDIDLSNCDYVSISGFAGTLDGNGYTINLGNNATQGVFATASNFIIKNLTVKGSINATAATGAFVGAAPGTATFINCKNYTDITSGSKAVYIGGILGDGFGSCTAVTFKNCINYGTIDTYDNTNYVDIGGLAGVTRNATVENCINYGKVNGNRYAGGLIGWSTNKLELSNCANFGGVYSKSYGKARGGAVGNLGTASTGYITNFLNAGQSTNGVAGAPIYNSTSTKVPYEVALSISNCVNVGSADYAMTILLNSTENSYYLEGKVTGSTGATSKTSDELKELDIEGFTVPTDIYGATYPVPSALTLTTNTVTVTASEGGSVSPLGLVKVNYGRSVTFNVTPDDGYYADDCSYNGAVIVLNNNNSYTTPVVTADATFDAQFVKLTDVDVSDAVLMYSPYTTSKEDTEHYGENGSVITFAKAAKVGPVTVTECGLLLDETNSMSNDELVYDSENVKVLPFDLDTYSLTENGCYGILIYNNYYTESKNYKVRAYAKYSNGKISYGEPSELVFGAINAQ